ncbi:Clp, repeat (R) domain containing protein [Fimbriimonadaceae bacterium]
MWQNFSEDARNTSAMAMKIAKRYGHKKVGPAHFLLGMLEQPNCQGTSILVSLGISIDDLRHELHQSISQQPASSGWFAKLDDSLGEALRLAELESKYQGRSKIGSEDILVGLLEQGNRSAAQTLVKFGVSVSSVRLQNTKSEIESAGMDFARFREMLRFSSEGRTAVYYASQAASERRQAVVETEHFLLGLLAVPDGCAIAVFNELHMDLDHLRTILEAEVSKHPASPQESPVLSADAYQAIQFAYAEAPLGDSNLSSHYILLGLMLVEDSAAAKILASVGVSLAELRRAVDEIQKRLG